VGQLAQESSVPLRVSIITDGDAFSTRKDHFGLQTMQFQISMGVRRGDDALRRALDRVIEQNRPQIEAVLERFGVPLINPASFSGANLAHSGAGIVGGAARRPGA
jgi:mxaJ protein